MPSFNTWASVLGPELVSAGQSYTKMLLEEPEREYKQEEIRAKRELLPLETEWKKREFQQKLAGEGKTYKTSHYDSKTGKYYAIYEKRDGTLELQDLTPNIGPAEKQGPAAPDKVPYKDWRLQQLRQMRVTGKLTDPADIQEYTEHLQNLPANRPQAAPESGRLLYPKRASLEELEQGAYGAAAGQAPTTAPQQSPLTQQSPLLQKSPPAQPRQGQPTEGQLPSPEASGVLQSPLGRAIRMNEGSSATSVSPAGAIGEWQIMPGTAIQYGFMPGKLKNPQGNAEVASTIIAALEKKYPGRPDLAMAEYHGGPGAVLPNGTINPASRDVNMTTQEYVRRGMEAYQRFAQAGQQPPKTSLPGETTIAPRIPVSPEAAPDYEAKVRAAETRGAGAPSYSKEDEDNAILLYNQHKFTNPVFIPGTQRLDLAKMPTRDQQLVIDMKKAAKDHAGYSKTLDKLKPYIAELTALRDSTDLVEMIEPLLKEKNVGMRGWATRSFQDFMRAIPGVPEQFKNTVYNSEIVELGAMKDMMVYTHANALKQIAGAPQRGVIENDLKHVFDWFNPEAWMANPDQLKAGLAAVQKYVALKSKRVEDILDRHNIDPKTYLPKTGANFPEGGMPENPNDEIEGLP